MAPLEASGRKLFRPVFFFLDDLDNRPMLVLNEDYTDSFFHGIILSHCSAISCPSRDFAFWDFFFRDAFGTRHPPSFLVSEMNPIFFLIELRRDSFVFPLGPVRFSKNILLSV